jgi:hypothetical protein
MIKIQLPVQSSTSATPDLVQKQVERPDYTGSKRRQKALAFPKQQLQLSHFSLTIEKRASSRSSNFRPRPRRIVLRSPDINRSRPIKKPHSSSLVKLRQLSSPAEAKHACISPQPLSYQTKQSNIAQSSILVNTYGSPCVLSTLSTVTSNARNSPVVSHRTKSPLTRFRQASPFRHRITTSLFDGRTSTALLSYRESVR